MRITKVTKDSCYTGVFVFGQYGRYGCKYYPPSRIPKAVKAHIEKFGFWEYKPNDTNNYNGINRNA